MDLLTIVLKALVDEYRTRRMARFAAWVMAYGIALWVAGRLARSSGGAPGPLWFLFWILFLGVAGYYAVRLVRFIRHRVLWRLRRRLIVAYLFIAVVPILLILLLVGLGVFIINGQFAAFLVTLKIREHVDELRQLNRVVGHEAHQSRQPNPTVLLDRLQQFYFNELREHAESYPGLEVTARVGPEVRAFRLDGSTVETPMTAPSWFKSEEFAGIVMDNGQLALRAVQQGPTPVGNMVVILSLPISPALLDLVGEGIGPVGVVTTRQTRPKERNRTAKVQVRVQTQEAEYVDTGSVTSKSVPLPPAAGRGDFTVFGASTFDPIFWGGDTQTHLKAPVFVYVTSRAVALNRQLLSTLGRFSQYYVITFLVVAVIFLVIEIFSLIIGVQLTRSITRAVDKLHDATERVKAGDFSYRINLPARDQLSALGKAFDGMTASVQRLLIESQEKLRLESELEIARQVQRQLFPQSAPKVEGLTLYGICKAARVVSGDYYDFLNLGDSRVGLVLGDVSGKGISAALLMATIQSSLRAQLYNGSSPAQAGRARSPSAAEVVSRLNRQLFESTSAEKYATFFYAEYDPATHKLAYTNAGHLPPMVFRNGAVERLSVGGTVVGLFWPMSYEQGEMALQPGDLLLAYTDGITEPENIYGEQFGEERVLEVVQRSGNASPEELVEEIYRTVSEWTGSPDLQDDMTLLVAKAAA